MAMFSNKAQPKPAEAAAKPKAVKAQRAPQGVALNVATTAEQPKPDMDAARRGVWAELVDGAARAFGFPRREAFAAAAQRNAAMASKPARQKKSSAKAHAAPRRDVGRATAEASRLAADGIDRAEIARRTGLSQDTIGLLVHLAPSEAAETAAGGTFFRILQARISA